MLRLQHRALYASFDRFPSCKGASIHIDRFSRALFDFSGGGLLYVLGDESLPAHQIEGQVEIVRFCISISNFLERTLAFGRRLDSVLDAIEDTLEIVHFRDPWSAVPLLARPRRYAAVYEVNAFPSIELPSAYPTVAPATLEKIRDLEDFALANAEHIITPSRTTRQEILGRGVPEAKITVIPNGADIPVTAPRRPRGAPARYILYFGALQEWQGFSTLLRAFSALRDLTDLRLVVCASHHSPQVKLYRRLAEKLEISDRIVWRFRLSQERLAPWRANALLSVAPLTDCARNVRQGCAPLKILESLAAGVPVVASDLAPVREIMSDGVEGRLVPPDRPAELARAIRILLEYPELRLEMARKARRRIEEGFTWDFSVSRLREVYEHLPAPRELESLQQGGVP